MKGGNSNKVLKIALCALILLPGSLVQAETANTWDVVAGGSTLFDSNLFRTDTDLETDDQITTTSVGLKADQFLSRQHFIIDAELNDNRYRENDYLNYRGKRANMSWDWTVTSALEGRAGLEYNESINSFVDYQSTSKNIRTAERYYLDADWHVDRGFWLTGGAARYQQENSALFLVEGDYHSDSYEYGVKYKQRSGSYLALVFGHVDGDYLNRVVNPAFLIDSGFEQMNAQLRYRWRFSGKINASGFLGYLEREHDHYGARDFQGGVGNLKLDYALTGAIGLNVIVKQDLVSYQTSPLNDLNSFVQERGYVNSSYYRLRSMQISPLWQYSDKITFRLGYTREQRDFRGGLVPELGDREDTIDSFLLSAEWTPLDYLRLSLMGQTDGRSSNRPYSDFSSDMTALAFQLTF